MWEASLPESPQKDYALEGTLAHEIAEQLLRPLQFRVNYDKPPEGGLEAIQKAVDQKIEELSKNPLYKPAMLEYCKDYVAEIESLLWSLKEKHDTARLYQEVRLDLSRWAPHSFGTSDCVIIAGSEMYVIDFKYGSGVKVDAKRNAQLMLYALGAYEAFSLIEDIDTIWLCIHQPRMENYSKDSLSSQELLDWGYEVVRPQADRASRGVGEYHGGPWCQFCKGRPICRYCATYMLEIGGPMGKRNPEMTPTEVAGVLERATELTNWATKVKDYALKQASERHVVYPGFKLVMGSSRRRITDERKALKILKEKGFTTEQVCTLKNITDLEKVLGTKGMAETLGSVIEKPSGKPTLVPDSDRRQPLDFSSINEEYGID